MAFSMQDLMASLPGSQPINPLSPTVNPLINPQIDRKQLAGDVATNKAAIKSDKNQKLGMMLYALGGALRGDKDFVQNTLALQQMQEGKKKQEETRAALKKWSADNKDMLPPEMISLYNALPDDKKMDLATSFITAKPTKGPSSYEEYIRTDDTPTTEEYSVFLQQQKAAGATKIDFGEKGFETLGPKKYEERLDLASSAQVSNVNLDNLENIINQGLETGFGAEIGLSLNRVGQLISGPEYKAGEIAGAESFAAGANKLILPLVKELGVNPTDKDLDFVIKGSPELSKSVEGNKLMLKALKLSNARAIDQHNFDNSFYGNPQNKGKTEVDRNIAFQIHMAENPQIYSSEPLIQEYNALLEREAIRKLTDKDFVSTQGVELPEIYK
ncbi:MAG: hypothetical protein ACO3H5_06195 [Candidatus Nanopelagicales bacterium]